MARKLAQEFNRVAKCPDAPPYEPGEWNSASIQGMNNCYAYAVDDRRTTRDWPQPGGAVGRPYQCYTGPEVARAAIMDGLIPVGEPVQKPGHYLVALLISPHDDYHWARQDDDGGWSHKAGNGEVSRLDKSGDPIVDPRAANWGRYSFFCYFHVPKGGIKVEIRDGGKVRAPAPVPKGFGI